MTHPQGCALQRVPFRRGSHSEEKTALGTHTVTQAQWTPSCALTHTIPSVFSPADTFRDTFRV